MSSFILHLEAQDGDSERLKAEVLSRSPGWTPWMLKVNNTRFQPPTWQMPRSHDSDICPGNYHKKYKCMRFACHTRGTRLSFSWFADPSSMSFRTWDEALVTQLTMHRTDCCNMFSFVRPLQETIGNRSAGRTEIKTGQLLAVHIAKSKKVLWWRLTDVPAVEEGGDSGHWTSIMPRIHSGLLYLCAVDFQELDRTTTVSSRSLSSCLIAYRSPSLDLQLTLNLSRLFWGWVRQFFARSNARMGSKSGVEWHFARLLGCCNSEIGGFFIMSANVRECSDGLRWVLVS